MLSVTSKLLTIRHFDQSGLPSPTSRDEMSLFTGQLGVGFCEDEAFLFVMMVFASVFEEQEARH